MKKSSEKNIDAKSTAEANALINRYRQYMPNKEDIFFMIFIQYIDKTIQGSYTALYEIYARQDFTNFTEKAKIHN